MSTRMATRSTAARKTESRVSHHEDVHALTSRLRKTLPMKSTGGPVGQHLAPFFVL